MADNPRTQEYFDELVQKKVQQIWEQMIEKRAQQVAQHLMRENRTLRLVQEALEKRMEYTVKQAVHTQAYTMLAEAHQHEPVHMGLMARMRLASHMRREGTWTHYFKLPTLEDYWQTLLPQQEEKHAQEVKKGQEVHVTRNGGTPELTVQERIAQSLAESRAQAHGVGSAIAPGEVAMKPKEQGRGHGR